jgi:UDP-galactopyranose mutase
VSPHLRRRGVDVLVVGAGFAGSVLAERLAADAGLDVLVVDRREHVAGNAFDAPDAHGVLCHRYGPHIFHTNAPRVADYLSAFTAWRPYEHRVLAVVAGKPLPLPINRDTLNALYGLHLETEADAEAYLASVAEPVAQVRTSEDVVVSRVGRELYELFFRPYTRKQWGLDPSELDASVTARILDHPRIRVEVGTDFRDVSVPYKLLVWTGPIDEYFGHRFGKLPYRSLRFEAETRRAAAPLQPVAQVNYPDERIPFTRVTEMRHLTAQAHDATTLVYEYPTDEGDPYYPVPRPETRALYKRYQALAERERDVLFVGRLARYQYLNMDQVVAQALTAYDRIADDLRLAA